MKTNYLILIILTILCMLSCKKKEEAPQYQSTVLVNGKTWHTNQTSPTTTGQYITLYYDSETSDVSFNIKDVDSGDNFVLVIKTDRSLSNQKITFDGINNYAFYYMNNVNLIEKVVVGEINISNLTIKNNIIENLDASFNFNQTAKDAGNVVYEHKIENGLLKNLKQTL